MNAFLSKYKQFTWVLLLVPIVAFLFLKLGDFHIRLWDESWFVVHAYEMYERGSLLVQYFDGEPVNYGTKPPLQTWFQMLAIHWMGYNELAVRLPSAMAAGGTVLLIFFWVKQNAGQTAAWIAALALITMDGFVHFHSARGAEADSLLTLVLVFQAFFFWRWTVTQKQKELWLTGLFIVIAFWTKSVAGFMLLPGMIVYLILCQRPLILEVLRSKVFYGVLGATLVGCASFIVLRSLAHEGYLEFASKMHFGRFLASAPEHDHPFDYYYNRFKTERLTLYLPLVFIGLGWPLFARSNAYKAHTYAAILAITYFIVIGSARSKLEWYALPLYPLFAMCIGFLLVPLFRERKVWQKAALILLLFIYPAQMMYEKTQANTIAEWSRLFEMKEEYLFRAYNDGKNLDGLIVINNHFEGALLFYKYKFQKIEQTIYIQNGTDVPVGSRVLSNSDEKISEILSTYAVDTVDQLENAIVFQINAVKND